MGMKSHSLPKSEHFELHQLAEGVYAAVATEGGAAFSNAGIIDLGDQTLIFDTFDTPIAAQDLKNAAEHLTGRPASSIIISHAHDDHWMGNQVFAEGTLIIATHETRQEMLISAEELKEFQENPSELEEEVREFEESLRNETDEQKRLSLENLIRRYRYAIEMLPTLDLRIPQQTFDGKVIFHGSLRSAELLTRGSGHTASDCFLLLPEEKIAFTGDLAFFQCQPFMASSVPEAWKAQLTQLEQSEIETFVPGHGPVGTKADITLQLQYIPVLEKLVAHIVRDGGTVEQAIQQPMPKPFDNWLQGGMARYEANVRFYYDHLSGEEESSQD
jgi:glyoxylase-like metal-dependent hydrolase (beta-lactamase superfamily II)